MTDTVTARLAEWEALTEAAIREAGKDRDAAGAMLIGAYHDRRIDLAEAREATAYPLRALLGFVDEVLRLTDEADAAARGHEPHRPCEAFARKVLADRIRAALTKRIGGSDEPRV